VVLSFSSSLSLYFNIEMTQLKKHIAYTFLAVFVCTAIIGIFGAIGVISIPATPLVTIFAFLAAQCITVIAAIIKAPNYFDDPLGTKESCGSFLPKNAKKL